ncbi:hypothetical protein C8F01DRAFT_1133603 [Mycena amicta]|nr:hypothetical protein C8F01DRAFT_1133603 [Mycena amicta]
MSVVDPRDYFPHLIVWYTFNTFAAFSNAFLLVITIITYNALNAALLNLIFVFILASACASLLAWSGHALDMHPPFGLCLWSAQVAMSNVPLMAGAAFAMVLKVWGSVMLSIHPTWRRVLDWIIWTPFLLLFPFVSALPLFFIGLAIGLHDRSLVYRGSPFYCVVNHASLQNAASGFGAAYTFLCLLFSAWITFTLITTRWRVRRIIDYNGISYPFVLRTLLFSCFVGVAFIVGILSLASTFSAIVPDVVLSSCNVAVFFIFSTSRPIIDFVFHCRRMNNGPTLPTSTSSPVAWRSAASNPVSPVDTPQEMLSFSISDRTSSTKRTTVALDDDNSVWGLEAAQKPDCEDGDVAMSSLRTLDTSPRYSRR